MNERILELAKQAGLYHRVNDNNFYPTALSAEQSSLAYQKFAELIVRECIDAVENSSDRHRRDYFAGKIRERFDIDQ